ncbi:hypothetical protein SCACP_38660 [Sporomusa carbonis]|uniref:UPF0236 family transposase-like protein n=1 Tax=Sporomusa carbonis TaxID=3076075 RepID=UPI003A6EE620
MEIIRVLMPIFLSIVEMVLNSLSGKMGFEEFQRKLADKLHEVGREITNQVLEELDQQIKNDKRKRSGWQVCRTGDSKDTVTVSELLGHSTKQSSALGGFGMAPRVTRTYLHKSKNAAARMTEIMTAIFDQVMRPEAESSQISSQENK